MILFYPSEDLHLESGSVKMTNLLRWWKSNCWPSLMRLCTLKRFLRIQPHYSIRSHIFHWNFDNGGSEIEGNIFTLMSSLSGICHLAESKSRCLFPLKLLVTIDFFCDSISLLSAQSCLNDSNTPSADFFKTSFVNWRFGPKSYQQRGNSTQEREHISRLGL